MTSSTKYCFDTSALVDMWYSLYPLDVFPGVWSALGSAIGDGTAIAPKEVQRELLDGRDDLAVWAQQNKDFFAAEDGDLVQRTQKVARDYPNLIEPKKTRFDADPWIVALAEREGAVVITHEKKTGKTGVGLNQPRLRIPDVCDIKGLPKGNVADFLRDKGVTLGGSTSSGGSP